MTIASKSNGDKRLAQGSPNQVNQSNKPREARSRHPPARWRVKFTAGEKGNADAAKKQFIARQVLIFGGMSSLLGIFAVYHTPPRAASWIRLLFDNSVVRDRVANDWRNIASLTL